MADPKVRSADYGPLLLGWGLIDVALMSFVSGYNYLWEKKQLGKRLVERTETMRRSMSAGPISIGWFIQSHLDGPSY